MRENSGMQSPGPHSCEVQRVRSIREQVADRRRHHAAAEGWARAVRSPVAGQRRPHARAAARTVRLIRRLAALCERVDCTRIAFDLPGFGHSDPASPGSVAGNASDIAEGLAKLGVGRSTLVGHSLGGAVATELAELIPDQVAALVLLAPAGFGRAVPWLPGGDLLPAQAADVEDVLEVAKRLCDVGSRDVVDSGGASNDGSSANSRSSTTTSPTTDVIPEART